jgi:hypothetical protein
MTFTQVKKKKKIDYNKPDTIVRFGYSEPIPLGRDLPDIKSIYSDQESIFRDDLKNSYDHNRI